MAQADSRAPCLIAALEPELPSIWDDNCVTAAPHSQPVASHTDTVLVEGWVVPAAVLADMGHCAGQSHLDGEVRLLLLLIHGSGSFLSCHNALYEHPVK